MIETARGQSYKECLIQYKLQRVLNAAASRVVSNCGTYDRGPTHFRCHVLHRLDVTDRIRFRLCIQVYKCQHSVAAGYLVDLCRPVSSIDSHKYLRSASRGQLQVPRISMSTYGAVLLDTPVHLLGTLCRTFSNTATLFTYF